MSEPRGATAGWRTAAIAAPAAAATLALATGWALEHQPATASVSPSPAAGQSETIGVQASVRPERADVALQRRALAAQARIVQLKRELIRLGTRTEAIRNAPIPSIAGENGGRRSGSGVGSTSVAAPQGIPSAAAPPIPAAPAPAPARPPATNTSTGAS